MTKHARRTDPDTSHESGTAIERAKSRQSIMQRILVELRLGKGASFQIANRTGIRPDRVWKRMSDLRNAKLVHDTGERIQGPDGKKVIVWAASPQQAMMFGGDK